MDRGWSRCPQWWLLVAALALWSLFATVPAAEACTCMARGCGVVSAGAVLFEATVADIERGAPADPIVVRLTDIRRIDGGAPPTSVLGGDGVNCGYQFRAGVRYLIEADSGGLVSMCSQTRPLVAARGLLEFLSAPSVRERPRVWGRVTAADVRGRGLGWPGGPAVDGATVTLEGPVNVRQTTGANGEFSFRDVPDGSYRLSVAIPPHRADVGTPAATAVTLTGETSCVNVDVTAPSTARVAGTVVDPAGAPAAGVFVEIFPAPYNQWAGGSVHAAISGVDGHFAIEQLPPGRYVGGIGVPYPDATREVAPALARSVAGGEVLDVQPGASLEVVTLVARPAPRITITGRTIAPPGTARTRRMLVLQPLDGLATARAYGGMTAEDGSFSINAHRGVRYRVLVEEGQRIVGRAEFVAGDGPLQIGLDPPR